MSAINQYDRGLPPPQSTVGKTLARNGLANILRLGAASAVALLIPALLVRHLPPATYNAWILVLQLGAYVTYLDLGIQTAVSKYIAEYHAKGDFAACSRILSSAVVLLGAAAVIGALGIVVVSSFTSRLFPTLPRGLVSQVRWGAIFWGASLAFSLPSSAFAGVFLGLQRNVVPMLLQSVSKVLIGGVTIGAVLLHLHISTMAASVAVINLIAAIAQVIVWKRVAHGIELHRSCVTQAVLKQLFSYCSVLTIWSISSIFIGGLDTTLVGHYDFHATAYYAVAANLTTFVGQLLAALLMPLIPAASALGTQRSATELGGLLIRMTRYSTLLTFISSLPFLLFGYEILSRWMGSVFATHSFALLRVLVLGYAVRQLALPYSAMIVGMGRQWSATISPVGEAVVNFSLSVVLARHMGAMGVAAGTLIGAFVGILLHFVVSMGRTMNTIKVNRLTLFNAGIIRPLLAVVPAVLVLRTWWRNSSPSIPPVYLALCFAAALLLAWYACLSRDDRKSLIHSSRRSIRVSAN